VLSHGAPIVNLTSYSEFILLRFMHLRSKSFKIVIMSVGRPNVYGGDYFCNVFMGTTSPPFHSFISMGWSSTRALGVNASSFRLLLVRRIPNACVFISKKNIVYLSRV
jgi:hypothetical protein